MKELLNKNSRQFNWSVIGTLESSLSCEKLWSIISSPSNLEMFHPFCKKNPTIDWQGLNSIDEVHYYNGLIYERKFILWEDKKGYGLLIGEKNKEKSLVLWEIFQKNNKSKLSISIYPHMYNKGNKVLNFLPFHLIVKPSLSKYINSVMNGLDYYIKTNVNVKKNQFGKHNFFSN